MLSEYLYHFKYYPDGDRDPESRSQRVNLTYDLDSGLWHFTSQKTLLNEEYLRRMRDAISEGRAKIVQLENDMYTEVRTDIAMVLSMLITDEV